jgi:hypothetical protein
MAMEQHPVPQNISSYEFRLVGDMTLKQFLQLAGGVVLAVIIYRLPVPGIIKYPFVVMVVIVGVVMAFVPVNNRPFSQWLSAFFKAIYSPTEYYWEPEAKPAIAAAPAVANTTAGVTGPAVVVPSFTSYIKSAVAPKTPATETVSENPLTGTLTVESISQFSAPSIAPQTVFTSPPKEETAAPAAAKVTAPPPAPVPATPTPSPEFNRVAPPPGPLPTTAAPVVPQAPGPIAAPASAITTSSLPTPTQANILSGLVTDFTGQAITGSTIEIVDQASGIPARALRTNRLGQFQIAIPLPPGTYAINCEKENYNFAPVSVQITHGIVQPIIISAKAV